MIILVRVNLVSPRVLVDEMLRAEYVELQMLMTFISKYSVGFIPERYTLGKGHMSFFRNKPFFIMSRLESVKHELNIRFGTKYKTNVGLMFIQREYVPSAEDIKLNESRIIDRLRKPLRKKNPWHYFGDEIKDIEDFIFVNY